MIIDEAYLSTSLETIRNMVAGRGETPVLRNHMLEGSNLELNFVTDMAKAVARGNFLTLIRLNVRNAYSLGIRLIKTRVGNAEMVFSIPPDFETNERWLVEVTNWVTEQQFAIELADNIGEKR